MTISNKWIPRVCVDAKGIDPLHESLVEGNIYNTLGQDENSDYLLCEVNGYSKNFKRSRFSKKIPFIYIPVSNSEEYEAARNILIGRGFIKKMDVPYHVNVKAICTNVDAIIVCTAYSYEDLGKNSGFELHTLKAETTYKLEKERSFEIPCPSKPLTEGEVLQYIQELKNLIGK